MTKITVYSKDSLANSNLALTVRPIFDDSVYLPENEPILKKLEKIFEYKRLHITICCTFVEQANILEKFASNIASSDIVTFDVNDIIVKNDTDEKNEPVANNNEDKQNTINSCILFLKINNKFVDDITNHIREPSLRGLQKSEYRNQQKYPAKDNYHLLLRVEEEDMECLKYIKQIEAVTIFLKEFGRGKKKKFEYRIRR